MLTSVLDRLDRATTGRLIRPTDTDYDDARRTFNALIDRRPAALVRCADAADVAATIAAALASGLPLGVRGGGHSVAGHAIVEGGLIVDLSAMRAVDIDVAGRVAHVAGGAQWLDLDTAALAQGLAVTGGVYGDTGVGGLTLGGGIGFLQGTAGFSCDNLIGAQVVTADGTIVEATDDPDLLWALRGGGGNFGVVTRLDMALTPVGAMYGGKAWQPLGDGAGLRRWREAIRSAPDAFNPMAVLLQSDDGEPEIEWQVAHNGPAEDGAALTTALLDEPASLHDGLGPCTYREIQGINPIEEFGRRNYWSSTFVTDLDDALIDLLVAAVSALPSPISGILIEPIHGAASRFGPDHAAFTQQAARFHVSAIANWEDPALDAECTAWSKRVTGQVRAWSTGGLYANYAMPGEAATFTNADRARAAWPPATYARLQTVKRRYDPTNLFRGNLNILPATD